MNAPPVQYVTTSDGRSIAYTVTGEGEPLVLIGGTFNHVQLNYTVPSAGSWGVALASRFKLIHYDHRGQGMSTRGLSKDFTLAERERDLEAVLDKLQPSSVVLLAGQIGCHTATQYALRHPDQVRALVFLNGYASGKEALILSFRELAASNWEVFLETISPATTWTPEERRSAVASFRLMMTQPDYVALADATAGSDVSDLVSRLRVPTLLLHVRDYKRVAVESASRLAALIPNSRLTLIDGSDAFGDAEQGMLAIEEFLAGLPAATPSFAPPARLTAGLSARELEVLRLLAAGRSNQQIADELVISLNTVNRHVSNIYAKIGAANRAEAASYATRRGLA